MPVGGQGAVQGSTATITTFFGAGNFTQKTKSYVVFGTLAAPSFTATGVRQRRVVISERNRHSTVLFVFPGYTHRGGLRAVRANARNRRARFLLPQGLFVAGIGKVVQNLAPVFSGTRGHVHHLFSIQNG